MLLLAQPLSYLCVDASCLKTNFVRTGLSFILALPTSDKIYKEAIFPNTLVVYRLLRMCTTWILGWCGMQAALDEDVHKLLAVGRQLQSHASRAVTAVRVV